MSCSGASFSPCLHDRSPWQALTEAFEHWSAPVPGQLGSKASLPITRSSCRMQVLQETTLTTTGTSAACPRWGAKDNQSCPDSPGTFPTQIPAQGNRTIASSSSQLTCLGWKLDDSWVMTEANHLEILLTAVPNEARGALLDCSWLCQHLPLAGTPLRTQEPSSLPHSKDQRWQWGIGWDPWTQRLLQVQLMPGEKHQGAGCEYFLNPRGVLDRCLYTDVCTPLCLGIEYDCCYSELIMKSWL